MENYELRDKTYRFASRAVKLHKYLIGKFSENELSSNLLKEALNLGLSGELAASETKGKMLIEQLRKANHHLIATRFYIRLLRDTEYLDNQQAESLLKDCSEIEDILSGILSAVQIGNKEG